MKCNDDVREKMRVAGVKQWMVADAIGISEPTLCRWMRKPLDHEKKEKVMGAIIRLGGAKNA